MRVLFGTCTLLCLLFLFNTRAIAQWDSVGNQGFSSGLAGFTRVAVSSGGIPYSAFRDGSISKTTVMSYNAGSWSAVGTAGISLGNSSYISLALDNNDTPYVAYADGGKSSKAIVKKYNGSSWVFVGDSTGVSAGSVTYINLARNKNNELYLAYVDGSKSSKITVEKYSTSSGNWDSVGNTGFSAISSSWLSLAFDTSGLPYVAYEDGSISSKLSVMRDSSNNWVYVGAAGISGNAAPCTSIAIDANNTPYVSYRDNNVGSKLTVMKYSGGNWTALGGTGFTINPVFYTNMHIDSHNIPYVVYEDYTIYKARAVRYSGGSWSAVGDTVFSGGSATYLSSFMDKNNNLYASYQDGSRSSKATVMRYLNGAIWDGSSWSNGTPGDKVDAIIASNLAPSSFSCNNLYINSGVSLNTGTLVTVTVKGNLLVNDGNGVSGTGTLQFNKSGTASITGDTVKFGGKVQVLSGCTLTTNNLLVLTSDASNTGSIGQSAGTISGNVGVQRYIPGKRCFRFLGHPFTDSIALSQLTDSIDITGAGGSTNGFTTTPTNNPSAFWFDPTLADTSTTGTNPGWVAFTSATTTSWKQYQLLRLLVRGAKGEGLSGTTYTPSAATFQATGPVNQGTQTVTLTKGANSEFVGCGNPYPSGVDMSLTVRGSNIGANYYAWDATSGTVGAYVTNAFSLSYVLPSFSAFFTTVSANTNNTIEFDESSKADGGASIYKTTSPANWVELQLADSNTHWDRLLIKLDDKAADTIDRQDAVKLYNPSLDFYTLSKEGKRLAIDARPYTDSASIPLGLTAYKMYRHYVIKTGMYNVPAGTKLYLHDKYLNKTEELTAGYQYWFEVSSDSNSQGVNRFELNMVGEPTTSVATTTIPNNKLQIVPNPAHSSITLSYGKQQGNVQIQVLNMTGQVVYSTQAAGNTGKTNIPIEDLAAGTYIAELKGMNLHLTEKFIKE